jgi:Niemann-Pick C1 protein
VAIVITVVLCLGLIRLNVETRPEKVFDNFVLKLIYENSVGICFNTICRLIILQSLRNVFLQLWVNPGSKALEEKEFFDSHLAPFYRIEQV